ncbi:TPA: hypothetical protein ACHTCR_004933 [Pseudomonas putida]|uniref:hypothetical protein n=1 Tax=Pseudomonas TaxID=286 RepID=UPI000F3D19A2|nr:hypothetical protein [Pseudomonas putida]RNF73214.1 hypothetical protein EFJ98_07710 [Pseudomonas putida]
MTPQLERLKGIAFSAACKSPKKSNPKRFEDIAIFMHELTPAVVVGLFEEIERLATSRSKKERELEQELEVWHHGPFCWTCGDTGDVHDITGEWRGECDCLSAQLINANRERDQLKAENEDYKSGQERYEQIIEDLKAEIEALRKDAELLALGRAKLAGAMSRLRAKHNDWTAPEALPAAELVWCACGDGFPPNSYGAGFMDANNGICWSCDAAKEANHG